MTEVEIILIIVGVVFMIGSFFVTEKLSSKELEKIAKLSEKEIKRIAEKELSEATERISAQAKQTVAASTEQVERALAKEVNEKIMAIGEYSDTVIENMNHTHNEIMFLYGMLNDRHTELTELTGEAAATAAELQKLMNKTALEQTELEILTEHVIPEMQKEISEVKAVPTSELSAAEIGNHNERIMDLYKQGKSCMDIAKELKLGIGEVKLVIDLFKGEK